MRNVKHNSIVTMTVAAAALALGAISTAAFAQDSPSAFANQRGSDAEVAARVKDALQSNATLDSRHIDVAVEHGEVHLKGFVQDPRTLLAANEVATKAAGDHKIVNELIIKENYADAP
jgi:hyperosmotically inducible periplasmic protein